MKRSASASKPFQSCPKGEIPGRARRKERLSRSKLKQAFPVSDSDDELFTYLIQCIRFGSWKVRRLNRAQAYFINFSFDRFPFLYTDWETKSLSLNPILKFMAYLLEL